MHSCVMAVSTTYYEQFPYQISAERQDKKCDPASAHMKETEGVILHLSAQSCKGE